MAGSNIVGGEGKVFYNGAWMTPSAADAQRKIDAARAAYEKQQATSNAAANAANVGAQTGAGYTVAPGGATGYTSPPGGSTGPVTPSSMDVGGSGGSSGGGGGGAGGSSGPAAPTPDESFEEWKRRQDASSAVQAEAEARRLGQIREIMAGFNTPAAPAAPGASAFDENAARDAMYARTKERIGLTSRAAIDSLRGQFANSGNIGRMNEGTEGVITDAAGSLGDFEREQAIQEGGRITDRGKEDRAAEITKRGQNAALIPQLMGLMTARGLY